MSVEDAKLLLAMGVSFSFVLQFFLDLYERRQKTFLSRKNSENFLDLIFPPEKRHRVNEVFLDFSRDVNTAFSPSKEYGNQSQHSEIASEIKFYENILNKYHKYLCLSCIESLRKSKDQTLSVMIALIFFVINSGTLVVLMFEPEFLGDYIFLDDCILTTWFSCIIAALSFLLPTLFFVWYIMAPWLQKRKVRSVWEKLTDKVQQETDKNKKQRLIKAEIREKYHSKTEFYVKNQIEKYIKNPTASG